MFILKFQHHLNPITQTLISDEVETEISVYEYLPSSSPSSTSLPIMPTFPYPEDSKLWSTATITKIIDGDTILLHTGQKLRYIGIDTPETVHPSRPVECYGKEASIKNAELVLGKEVRLEKDISETDQYGRLLRYVWLGDIMVNELLLAEGYAQVDTYPPDVKYKDRLQKAEKKARQEKIGFWNTCQTESNTQSAQSLSGSLDQSTDESSLVSQPNNPSNQCQIKGNISKTGKKVYHTPDCPSYDKTIINESANERWFCNEQEAELAGWTKANNCSN